ncbi:MAG: hypothetical protein ABI645_14050 [Pseudomonadota bacterium]
MKILLMAIGALLVISGIVSVNLWLDLRTERLENTHLTTQLAEAAKTPHTPANSAQQIAAPAPAAVVSGSPTATVAAPLLVDSAGALKATEASVSAGAVAAAKGSGDTQLMKDPEYRKAQLTMTRLRLAQNNPGLAETLGLSEKEAHHFYEVMAESQLNSSAERIEAMARAGMANAPAALNELLRNTAGREDPARAALGEAKYAQYQEYQGNVRPALQQVASIGGSLEAAGQPLNDSQTRTLTAAMMTEQQRLRQEAAIPRPIPNPGVRRGIADTLTESANRQQESNRRILEASAATLNAAQLEVLKQQFEQQDATRRRSIETARDMDARRVTLPQPATLPARAP